MFFRKLKQILLISGDILLLYFSLWLTLLIRYGQIPSKTLWFSHLISFSIIFLFWLIVFYLNDLYNLNFLKNTTSFFSNLFRSLIINLILAVVFFYFLSPQFTPKRILFLNLIIFTLLFTFWRFIFNQFLVGVGPQENLLIIKSKEETQELIKKIIKLPALGFNLKAVINLEKTNHYNLEDLKNLIKKEKITTVVLDNPQKYPEIIITLYQFLSQGVKFFDLASFSEKFISEIPVSVTEEIWFLENLRDLEKRFYEIFKRFLDIFLALILGLISLIFYPLIILTIKLFSPGPIFYRQKRVGRLGKEFTIIKFRTMIPGAEKNGPKWAEENDERVTKIGRFLRNTRLDELPQLFNILKGEMSFVGPRPERPEFVKDLTKKIPHYHLRHLIRPGLTGWAQINYPYGASVKDALKKLQYDLFYLKNRSFILDLKIILKTINLILQARGR